MKLYSIFIRYYQKMRKLFILFLITTDRFIHMPLFLCILSFPHLLCSPIIIETLMNIIHLLSISLNEDNVHKVIAHHNVPNTDYTIQFIDTHEKRLVCLLKNIFFVRKQRRILSMTEQELFNTFIDFARMFVEHALMISPTIVKSCIQVRFEHILAKILSEQVDKSL